MKLNSWKKVSRIAGICAVTVATLLQTSCSTDFELNAPYKEIPIVYGLLNQTQSTHLFTINKSFLGAGSAYDFAGISDSSEYETVEATIKEYVDGVATGRAWTLQDTMIDNKEDGLWYTEGAKAYYFNCPDSANSDPAYWEYLNQEAEYRLEARVDDSADPITGTTTLVKNFSIATPFNLDLFLVGFATSNSSIDNTYPSQHVEWTSSENSRRYELKLEFHYTEFFSATDSVQQVLEWNLGTQKTLNDDGGEGMTEIIEGESFYLLLRDNIAVDAAIVKRVPRSINFIYTVAGEDLHTYMEVNEPSTGIVQERPEYSNIGNGIGVFSSRYVKVLRKQLNKNSTKELCNGQYTAQLQFCSDRVIHQLENYYCP